MSKTGTVIVLLILLTAEMAKRQGLSPLKTLGQAASGQAKLR